MIGDIVQIDFFLLVFSEDPLSVLDVFVEIGSRFELGVGFPLVPTAAINTSFEGWSWFQSKSNAVYPQSRCVFEDCFELLNITPLFFLILSFID
jgi:hypothetical protein